METLTLNIAEFMKNLMENYGRMRGTSHSKHDLFWDIVVISAADEKQAKSFNSQIKKKQELRRIPDVPYHVFPDIQGVKMGSGGSTLHILDSLETTYGSHLYEMKILLIHAGGQSKRLPSHSVLGKLFAPLPQPGSAVFDMLDLKLAMYLPFLVKMKPGIFLTCSDDIETYALTGWDKPEIKRAFEEEGFVALAHPSTIGVGTTHGVYVLPPDTETESCRVTSCLEVLQKPSMVLMQEKGAIVRIRTGDDEDKEFVYTDSAFFFDTKVMRQMLQFYKTAKPISSEIDAYRDFLQKLGSRSRVDALSAGDAPTAIQDVMAQFPLRVVVIPKSRFYHIGTMFEYIDNLCTNQEFAAELGLSRFVNSAFALGNASSTFKHQSPSNVSGVIMHSKIVPSSTIGSTVVIEHCAFLVPICIEQYCILSNCEVISAPGDMLTIPSHSLFFTVDISLQHLSRFVTVSFSINDDLKCTCKSGEGVSYFGASICELENLAIVPKASLSESAASSISLWDAKLFEVKETMTDAFLSTLNLVCAVLNRKQLSPPSGPLVSMDDILNQTCIEKMLAYRNQFFM